jgi:hypothetical protein
MDGFPRTARKTTHQHPSVKVWQPTIQYFLSLYGQRRGFDPRPHKKSAVFREGDQSLMAIPAHSRICHRGILLIRFYKDLRILRKVLIQLGHNRFDVAEQSLIRGFTV